MSYKRVKSINTAVERMIEFDSKLSNEEKNHYLKIINNKIKTSQLHEVLLLLDCDFNLDVKIIIKEMILNAFNEYKKEILYSIAQYRTNILSDEDVEFLTNDILSCETKLYSIISNKNKTVLINNNYFNLKRILKLNNCKLNIESIISQYLKINKMGYIFNMLSDYGVDNVCYFKHIYLQYSKQHFMETLLNFSSELKDYSFEMKTRFLKNLTLILSYEDFNYYIEKLCNESNIKIIGILHVVLKEKSVLNNMISNDNLKLIDSCVILNEISC